MEAEKHHLNVHARRAFSLHDRIWQQNKYVYPVVSRRSKGLSIGVNLNPDKVCNFDCIYCSVDRREPVPGDMQREVDLVVLRHELATMLQLAASGAIYRHDPFDKIPAGLARVNDIAFSGDGEPTTCRQFLQICQLAAELKETYFPTGPGGNKVKLVLITNATMFQRPNVIEGLAFLDQHEGEIWAKLDAGTEEYFQLVDRSAFKLTQIVENIKAAAKVRPLVIQTLLMKVHGAGPSKAELTAYIERLREIMAAGEGGRMGGAAIKLVQVYTVARFTTEAYATALSAEELEQIAGRVREGLPGVAVEIYP